MNFRIYYVHFFDSQNSECYTWNSRNYNSSLYITANNHPSWLILVNWSLFDPITEFHAHNRLTVMVFDAFYILLRFLGQFGQIKQYQLSPLMTSHYILMPQWVYIDACDCVIFEIFALLPVNWMEFLSIFIVHENIPCTRTYDNRVLTQCNTCWLYSFILPPREPLSQLFHSLRACHDPLNYELCLSLLLSQNFCRLNWNCFRVLQLPLCVALESILGDVHDLKEVDDCCIAFCF